MNEHFGHETIIYGGAFNPPTRAHQAITQACVDFAEQRGADVWLLPSATRSDKAIEVSYERRLEYCRALLDDVLQRTVTMRVESMELDRGIQTETYDTVRELERSYPDREFRWVFGADSVASMGAWDHGEWLRDTLSMLVVERPSVAPLQLGANAVQLAVATGAHSSTALRQRMHDGDPFDDMVSESVYRLLTA